MINNKLFHKLLLVAVLLLLVLLFGTAGFWFFSGKTASAVDALYMTVITITTIGFEEVIDLGGNPAGRTFTIVIALSGIGLITYLLTNLTAFIIEGELKDSFWRNRMEKKVKSIHDHYIVCGIGNLGISIIDELLSTGRDYVIVDQDRKRLLEIDEKFRNSVLIEGDAMEGTTLERAGLNKAAGLFAVTGDDNQNLIVSLTAKQAKPSIHVVAECGNPDHNAKMKMAGADTVISPSRIGGLRMASAMLRPTVVSFLDQMLREDNGDLRIEEVILPQNFTSCRIEQIDISSYPSLLLLAVSQGGKLHYNPPTTTILQAGDRLICMGKPAESLALENRLATS
ncbi:MAG: potassium transporter TrkA [Desulfuromonas sp.]|nr:MAG: potassium transporter TrkA [Desulfuromonas sp.]